MEIPVSEISATAVEALSAFTNLPSPVAHRRQDVRSPNLYLPLARICRDTGWP